MALRTDNQSLAVVPNRQSEFGSCANVVCHSMERHVMRTCYILSWHLVISWSLSCEGHDILWNLGSVCPDKSFVNSDKSFVNNEFLGAAVPAYTVMYR